MYSYGPPHMAAQKQDDQLERTFSSYVRIQDVVLKTYLGRWTIGRSGERGSGISVLLARYDDDDSYYTQYIYIYKVRNRRDKKIRHKHTRDIRSTDHYYVSSAVHPVISITEDRAINHNMQKPKLYHWATGSCHV